MKTSLSVTLLVVIVGFSLFQCDIIESEKEGTQTIISYANYDTSYYQEMVGESVGMNNVEVDGAVLGDPIPEFEYAKVNDKKFSGSEYSSLYQAFINFGDDSPIRVTSNLNTVNVELKTSEGSVQGEVSKPERIFTIMVNNGQSSIQLGNPLTISWIGGNADFYYLTSEYDYESSSGGTVYRDLDTLVTGNSVTFSGDNFLYNGHLDYIEVEPINGPYPEKGAEGNMSGDGNGFLYYTTVFDKEYDGEITVGSGLNKKLEKSSSDNRSEEEKAEKKLSERIKSKILGKK